MKLKLVIQVGFSFESYLIPLSDISKALKNNLVLRTRS